MKYVPVRYKNIGNMKKIITMGQSKTTKIDMNKKNNLEKRVGIWGIEGEEKW